jgi:hypothetical protein
MIRRLFLLLTIAASCAQPAFAQSVAERAKARGDSILAVAKCWRAVKPLPAGAMASMCPDSIEAARLAAFSPLARATAHGVEVLAQSGDTVMMRAVLIHGFVFVGPAHGSGLGGTHADLPMTTGQPGRAVITMTMNGLVGRATIIVVPRADVRFTGAPELPRSMAQMDAMIADARAADTITRQLVDMVDGRLVPRSPPVCVRAGITVPCPPGMF